ncbi:hypothetical protein CPB84DRAFT_1796430 [Gymnopilus junonius]|uniref:Uncharacterized protein n=1 Tax=Gymnopilus junonius TaxID=109634 RepID=A0A9P5N8Y4_GYMJU|nr:hypothetical protein CPB84DRAFT_1796430 [Gymnopilus junonius]
MPKNIDRVSSESPFVNVSPEADWRSNVNMSPPIRSSSSAGPNTKTKQEGGVLSTPKAPDRSLSKPSEVPSAYINQNKGRSVDQPTPPPSLVRDKGKGRQKDANPIPSRGQTNTVDVKSFKMRERTPDPLCIPGPTPLTTDTDTIPPRKPLGYPSLKEIYWLELKLLLTLSEVDPASWH